MAGPYWLTSLYKYEPKAVLYRLIFEMLQLLPLEFIKKNEFWKKKIFFILQGVPINMNSVTNSISSFPSKKKYKERRRKGAPLIMSRSSKTELRFSKNGGSAVSYTDAIEVHRTEWFTEHRFCSAFRAPLLLLS